VGWLGNISWLKDLLLLKTFCCWASDACFIICQQTNAPRLSLVDLLCHFTSPIKRSWCEDEAAVDTNAATNFRHKKGTAIAAPFLYNVALQNRIW
jgi:hypothetical protein